VEDEITIPLVKPIVIGKGEGAITCTEMTLREPTAGELEKAGRADTNIGSLITLVSLITKQPRSIVEKFSRTDIQAAEAALGRFTGGGLTTPESGND
jgi:hypothetical protein